MSEDTPHTTGKKPKGPPPEAITALRLKNIKPDEKIIYYCGASLDGDIHASRAVALYAKLLQDVAHTAWQLEKEGRVRLIQTAAMRETKEGPVSVIELAAVGLPWPP